MILEKHLPKREVPALPAIAKETWDATRRQLIDIMCEKEYGTCLPAPDSVTFEEGEITTKYCAGFGVHYPVTAHTVICGKPFDFTFTVSLPTRAEGPVPFFVLNNFHRGEPNMYLPIEEIIDRGFAVLHVNYEDITSDDGDFTTGVAACIYPDGGKDRGLYGPGKIQMWAWGSMRIMDYAMTCDKLDHENGAVIGHSRLGKTALVTGMQDERFRYICSNNAGCSGDAITRRKEGERIRDITDRFPYWFCENYKSYVSMDGSSGSMDFDQHFLFATMAPRVVMVGAAYDDNWADPISQQLCCVAASPAWEALGEVGYVSDDRDPQIGDHFYEGNLCFHLRQGCHFLSRLDWNAYMDAIESKMKKG
jgi:hypothetical protein